VTIISEKFARENKIKFSESDIKVEVANDHVIDVVGQTNELHIEIKSHTCDLNMLVLPNSNFQVLLGLNWFMESGCSVNPAKRTLQFKSEFFSLDGNEEDMSEEEEATFFADVNQGEDEDKDICQDWYGSPYTGIKPVIKFSQPQMDIVDVLSKKIKDNFASDFKGLKRCTLVPYKSRLINPDLIINVPKYRKSIVEHDFIDEVEMKNSESALINIQVNPVYFGSVYEDDNFAKKSDKDYENDKFKQNSVKKRGRGRLKSVPTVKRKQAKTMDKTTKTIQKEFSKMVSRRQGLRPRT